MKKPLLLAVLAGGVVTVIRKRQAGQASSATWQAATTGSAAPSSAQPATQPSMTSTPQVKVHTETPEIAAEPEQGTDIATPAQTPTPAVAEQLLAEEVSTDAAGEPPAHQADTTDEQIAAEKVVDESSDKDLPST